MFAVSRLFTKTSDFDAPDQYIKIASLIEEGSVLDRRKLSQDRRSTIERRVRLRDAFYGKNKRNTEKRRITSSRRIKEHLEKITNERTCDSSHGKNLQSLSSVERLILDQTAMIKRLSELSEVAKSNKFEGVQETIRDISLNIKNITHEEEILLYLSFDKNSEKGSDEDDKSLAEILFYIHDVSDQVLEYLDRYHIAGVTEANIGFFLLDMNIVYKALSQILNKKKEHLYPLYK